jgi:hypothetical protein
MSRLLHNYHGKLGQEHIKACAIGREGHPNEYLVREHTHLDDELATPGVSKEGGGIAKATRSCLRA